MFAPQILHSSVLSQFYFFTRWGRTGTTGSCKLEGPFDELGKASALFSAKFNEKTGNDWDADDQEDRYLVNSGGNTGTRALFLFAKQICYGPAGTGFVEARSKCCLWARGVRRA